MSAFYRSKCSIVFVSQASQSIHELTSYNTNSKSKETCEWDGERKSIKRATNPQSVAHTLDVNQKMKRLELCKKKQSSNWEFQGEMCEHIVQYVHLLLVIPLSRSLTLSICLPLSFSIIFVDFFGMHICMHVCTHSFGLYLLIFSFSFIQRAVEIPAFCCCLFV